MTTYLLDTNVVSDLMRGDARVHGRYGALTPNESAVICPIVRGEILFGIARLPGGKRRRDIERSAAEFFSALVCVAVPEDAGDAYARVKYDAIHAGFNMGECDLWVAATALALDATLVSRDRDFARIKDLRTEDWSGV